MLTAHSELLKLNLNNCHCRHIVLGCSHDNGYARLLEDESNPANLKRITLLEGVPFGKELHILKSRYHTVKFDDLFRDTKIRIPDANHHQYNALPQKLSSSPPTQPTQTAHPDGKENANGLSKASSPWAATAAFVPSYQSQGEERASSPSSAEKGYRVPVNRFGQRVDWPLKVTWDKQEIEKIRSMHLCQKQYLVGNCYKDDCKHQHDVEVTPMMLEYLKYFVRLLPCVNGLKCQEKNCMYGHGESGLMSLLPTFSVVILRLIVNSSIWCSMCAECSREQRM